jgi:organic hydroperoxide reductase OsmC/OhrA
MPGPHTYRARLVWEGNLGEGTATYQAYSRQWKITIDGKPDLEGSADPSFRGDAGRLNPEDLLVASLASCHMLSYLALCARNGIAVTRYTDEATGTMVSAGTGGRFESVQLAPRVSIAQPDKKDLARRLHEQAHADCFIASSVNFPVRHSARVEAD